MYLRSTCEADDDNAQGGKSGTKTGIYNVVVTVTNVDETPEITTTAASHTAPSFMEIEYDATIPENLVVADYDGTRRGGARPSRGQVRAQTPATSPSTALPASCRLPSGPTTRYRRTAAATTCTTSP